MRRMLALTSSAAKQEASSDDTMVEWQLQAERYDEDRSAKVCVGSTSSLHFHPGAGVRVGGNKSGADWSAHFLAGTSRKNQRFSLLGGDMTLTP